MSAQAGPLARVRFLKTWGHPSRDLICGPGTEAIVSLSLAGTLVHTGYAELVEEKEETHGQIEDRVD